jgi:uncharacterized protein
MRSYYANMRERNYEKAAQSLGHNKLIKKDRNALLYNLEMGKLHRLQNDFVKSNYYLNIADGLIENNTKSVADIALANLVNPMQQFYRGEDHEQFMTHFYKALNYASLGQMEDAVVEARRITLSTNAQGDKFRNKENRYSKDAFALNLQGMIYEMAGDINNAFIAYRNAVDIYLKSDNEYYGVKMPMQLQQDLLRTATSLGFTNEQQQYEKAFNVSYSEGNAVNGELILFLEEGQAPIKQEKNFFLTAGSNGIGNFNYLDPNGQNSNFNFNYNDYGIAEERLSSLRAFKLSLPVYTLQYTQPQNITVRNAESSYVPQLAQNINNVAVNVLKERFITEMANALARQIAKKLIEKGTEALAEGIANKKDKKEAADTAMTITEKEQKAKAKQEKAKLAGDVAGFVMNVVNTVTEKADTRNWQSLPAFVSYVRIPLHAGENTITVTTNGQPITLKVNAGRGLQMMSVLLD